MTLLLLLAILPWFPGGPARAEGPGWTRAPVTAGPPAGTWEPAEVLPASWLREVGVYATVYGPPGRRSEMRRVAGHAATAIPRIAGELGLPAGRPIHIVLTDSQAAFRSLQPGAPPAWADATAWPELRLVVLRSPRLRPGTAAPIEQVLDHEIVHVVLGQAFWPRRVPRWLQEGLAQWFAGEVGPETARELGRGTFGHGLFTLEELTGGFPVDTARARLAYAQSADLVAWIAGRYGPEALRRLVGELAGGRPVRAAFRAATGASLEEVDRAWRGRLVGSPPWLRTLFSDEALLGLGAVLLVVTALRVRLRNRRRLARWQEEETPPARPAAPQVH